jgi:hypothetical protein
MLWKYDAASEERRREYIRLAHEWGRSLPEKWQWAGDTRRKELEWLGSVAGGAYELLQNMQPVQSDGRVLLPEGVGARSDVCDYLRQGIQGSALDLLGTAVEEVTWMTQVEFYVEFQVPPAGSRCPT